MVNLYEFLGIEKTDNVAAIQTAIELAEMDGKDAKGIAACKLWLLNDGKRAQYNQALSIKRVAQPVSTQAPAVEAVAAAAPLSKPVARNAIKRTVKSAQNRDKAAKEPTPVWKVITAVVLGLVALSAFVQMGMGGSSSGHRYTMQQFQQIQDGMSEEQLFSVVGQGKVASQMDTTVIYQYVNKDGSNIIITVQDGRVLGKAQAGL